MVEKLSYIRKTLSLAINVKVSRDKRFKKGKVNKIIIIFE